MLGIKFFRLRREAGEAAPQALPRAERSGGGGNVRHKIFRLRREAGEAAPQALPRPERSGGEGNLKEIIFDGTRSS